MEKPNWSVEQSFLSLRDIGRLLLSEVREWLEKSDTELANAINTEEDEAA